ncbi:MAG: hypothetical protein [Wendovervirus sonii]|uniref:Uncharacterized protein n=1 Tax=phage Lak_Megaphage_Sonny TaxID=3109229 RepID=A0ABZ0Z2I1_9CAUD|nr:MAG: hypothetical protein [phage Lak_Megaphage_Sonny]
MKIQSESDIITNSSSEVFLINAQYAESMHKKTCMPYEYIDIDYLKDHPYMVDVICMLAGIERPEFIDDFGEEWFDDCMESFINNHIEKLNEYLKNGYALLCNDNSFYKNNEILQEIREKSEWYEYQ